MTEATNQHGRYLEIDPNKLTALLNHHSISVEVLAGMANVSVGTVNNMLRGRRSLRSRVLSVAEALGTTPATLLRDSRSSHRVATIHEYLVAELLTDWVTTSNGLRFQVCRLRHVELDRQARGKRFDLRGLPTDEEQRCRTWIKRHPTVCDALKGHTNIAHNITAFRDPVESYYWVIDEWIEGQTLQKILRKGAIAKDSAKRLMLDMALGLKALHDQGIVRRELNPATVMIRDRDSQAILTEFELAKLIDRGPTVSTDEWPVDPYRAGEAEGDDVDVRADVYSWARIAIHAVLGELPEIGSEDDALSRISLPSSIRVCLGHSSAPLRSGRPASFDDIIPLIRQWK